MAVVIARDVRFGRTGRVWLAHPVNIPPFDPARNGYTVTAASAAFPITCSAYSFIASRSCSKLSST